MYTREIQSHRTTPLERGKPLQGTWLTPFDEVDLLAIQKPFSFPLPRLMRDWRIKEWETFVIQDDRIFLAAIMCNVKYFCWSQIFLYDKESKEKLRFRKFIPFSGWRMPRTLSNAAIDSRFYGFFSGSMTGWMRILSR